MARRARAGAVLSAALLMMAPNAVAAPAIPDVDSLIDDSGTLPGSISDLPSTPIVVFATDSGLVCRVWQGKITHDVNCTGDIPGAPPAARSVQLPGIYGKGTIPARFVAGPPEALVGGTPATARLPVGHKIVFWDFPPTQSMVCGVPPSTELVCVLKEPQSPGDVTTGPVVTHGFVIAAPQSQVF
ncbi:hypothetical protein [Mycolicibacter sinensis]|uniref:Uncharacterized protein n=1 Tax=Mycolicibacter sinensis (strain JDM601) TaxID=875328 RepID=A0A1A2EZC6_MYCSD|nr:hypothetical protein [Mycolicibacter sinensis]OBG02372.1 hypothetical protein A5772_07820 [Mycolicibacter sinensis]OBG09884.1 hypothetical protein A5771_00990 [Mycolicibacter sinensis]